MSTRKIALIGMLAAVAVAGRMAFQGVPNVQPATILIVLTGMFFGWRSGAMLGVIVALTSGVLTGLGYWTPFQVAAWGIVGAISGFVSKDKPIVYVGWLIGSAFVFGLVSSLSMLVVLPIKTAAGFYVTGLMFDAYHAIGNLAFGLLSPILFKVFENYSYKF